MLPAVAALATYGGALNDYSPVVDSTVDRSATGVNPALGDIAAMTHTAVRAWARTTVSSSAPVLVAHDEMWNNGNVANVAPVPARTTNGVYTLTWPSVVFDEIPAGLPGYNASGTILNFRAAWATDRAGTATLWFVKAVPTAPNVVTVYTWNASGSLADPASIDVDVFVI